MENLLRVVTTMTNGGSHTLGHFTLLSRFSLHGTNVIKIKHANHSAPKDLGIGFQAELFDW